MLVLRVNSKSSGVQIGDDTRVVVVDAGQRKDGSYWVKLGFDAPRDVRIVREDALERDRQTEDAA